MAVTPERYVLMLIVDKCGEPINVTRYYASYLEELQPIAFVDGFEDLTFIMRNLPPPPLGGLGEPKPNRKRGGKGR